MGGGGGAVLQVRVLQSVVCAVGKGRRVLRKWGTIQSVVKKYQSDPAKERGKPERGFQTQMPTESDVQ